MMMVMKMSSSFLTLSTTNHLAGIKQTIGGGTSAEERR